MTGEIRRYQNAVDIIKTEVVTNCDHLQSLKFRPTLPYAFIEQGIGCYYIKKLPRQSRE